MGLDNSAVSFNANSAIYLEEEIDILWGEQDPDGQEIFMSRMHQRLPEWEELFKEAANQSGLHWTLLAAISYQESHRDPNAISKTGVRGLGISKRTDPKQSVIGGSIYFNRLLKQFPDSIPRQDKLWMTIAAYNLGFSYLREAREVTKSNNQNPNSWKEVSKSLSLMAEIEQDQLMNERISEALDYVQKVQLYYQTLSVNKRIFVF